MKIKTMMGTTKLRDEDRDNDGDNDIQRPGPISPLLRVLIQVAPQTQ